MKYAIKAVVGYVNVIMYFLRWLSSLMLEILVCCLVFLLIINQHAIHISLKTFNSYLFYRGEEGISKNVHVFKNLM